MFDITIRVSLFRRTDRKCFYAQWRDPVTGIIKQRSTRCTVRRDAERVAVQLEIDLDSGRMPKCLTWAQAKARYEAEVLAFARKSTRDNTLSDMRRIERVIRPARPASITPGEISKLSAAMLSEGRSPASLKRVLTTARKFLRFCHHIDALRFVPNIQMPKGIQPSKGRAITGEEFDRMIDKTPEVVGTDRAESWVFLLRGLWHSGLRLSESFELRWEDGPFVVDVEPRLPVFVIDGSVNKNGKTEQFPVAPEFAQFLRQVPQVQRCGFVFNPVPERGPRQTPNNAGRVISAIGEKAGIRAGRGKLGADKWASAHDFRRAFGLRWSGRVLPAVLQALMRHSDIATTMKYYARRNAEVSASAAWEAFEAIEAQSAAVA